MEIGRSCVDNINGNNGREKLFQNLTFLVREWTLTESFGLEGGKNDVLKPLSDPTESSDSNRKLWNDIITCFDKVSCFLMPQPGRAVERSKGTFTGLISGMQ